MTAAATAAVLLLSSPTVAAAAPQVEPSAQMGRLVAQSTAAPRDDSIAVTSFSNISGAAEDDWVGIGIVETLTADLERVAGVSVVGRQTVAGALETVSTGQGAGTEATDLAAGRRLGARWVVSGAYQRLGDRMRITARVVDVATARVVHTAMVDGTVTELFALQDRLAAELRGGLTPAAGAPAPPARRRPRRPRRPRRAYHARSSQRLPTRRLGQRHPPRPRPRAGPPASRWRPPSPLMAPRRPWRPRR